MSATEISFSLGVITLLGLAAASLFSRKKSKAKAVPFALLRIKARARWALWQLGLAKKWGMVVLAKMQALEKEHQAMMKQQAGPGEEEGSWGIIKTSWQLVRLLWLRARLRGLWLQSNLIAAWASRVEKKYENIAKYYRKLPARKSRK